MLKMINRLFQVEALIPEESLISGIVTLKERINYGKRERRKGHVRKG